MIIKVSYHSAEERNLPALLGATANSMCTSLEIRSHAENNHRLHYGTARELYNIINAAEAGRDGDLGQSRDYLVPPYLDPPPSVIERGSSRGR